MRFLFGLLAFLGFASSAARGDPVRTSHVTAGLVLENETLVAGATKVASDAAGAENYIGIRLEMIPEWHTYWRFPGDSGLPTEITWHLPEGWSAGPIQW